MHSALLTEKGTLQTNDGRLGRSETASNDGGERNERAEKEAEGIRLRGPEIFAKLSESASNHKNKWLCERNGLPEKREGRRSDARDTPRGLRGWGEGVNLHNNGWGNQHETPGDGRGPVDEQEERGDTPFGSADPELHAKPSRNHLDTKTPISQQRLRGILQSRCPQEGFGERNERPEKREERCGTAELTSSSTSLPKIERRGAKTSEICARYEGGSICLDERRAVSTVASSDLYPQMRGVVWSMGRRRTNECTFLEHEREREDEDEEKEQIELLVECEYERLRARYCFELQAYDWTDMKSSFEHVYEPVRVCERERERGREGDRPRPHGHLDCGCACGRTTRPSTSRHFLEAKYNLNEWQPARIWPESPQKKQNEYGRWGE
ncbi:hypothetical protein F5J12DRAFT_787357 [Pisolithus orientalis]|uniref:uncharacterized protein n=1 Tax=Pisolithus orientalis TaxID=936130 RepID=UPI0022259CE8|nr:uncharacterized protein F5J12DRAFT_787357 [Pisolithus orientalis]KAI5985685.1 hypothetical protein F5J12DRAFT_787357 [Pisolithus orientalis]